MSDWQALERELDRWDAAGRSATLWWRDDDAGARSPALDRLLGLAARHGQPLALAVIPNEAQAGLETDLARPDSPVSVLQHGFAHRNHAPAGAKKCELIDPQTRPEILAELRQGGARLQDCFGARALSVLVPPWNRIDPALCAQLPGLGITGLSTYKARDRAVPLPGLQQVNCHLDIMQWRPERRFLGEAAALDLLAGHLKARREGTADPAEPSGILSHHAAHDDDAWDFLDRLLDCLGRHRAARLLSAAETFAPAKLGTTAGKVA
ncbi:hypothetical protein HBA54_24035 [Pelagibius litoralis]|uniref:Polysaccharide deacetylase n=1 Tax=Pelagibius litoralis TaxID=374515 RepID=A0A967KCG6_9PROT|nr:polysaccharide deacetylase family protein [Pelagibius litoralis]NIA71667.1 hypothetical protein [Pelagibius litoralis]